MQLYSYFYKQHGVRRIQNFLSPVVGDLIDLPKSSVIHKLTHDVEHPDVDTSSLYLEKYPKKIYLEYPSELNIDSKAFRKNGKQIRSLVHGFHLENKKYIYKLDAYKNTNDPTALFIFNYDYLDKLYTYNVTPRVEYDKWRNLEITRWKNIESIASSKNENHFVFLNVPVELPSMTYLRTFSKVFNLTMLKVFNTADKLFVLELWKWISSEHRPDSVINNISINNLSKVNIVFITPTKRSSILNLGYINSWIKGGTNLTEFPNVQQYDDNQIQKLFLAYLLSLSSLREAEVEEVIEATSETESKKVEDETFNNDEEDEDNDENIVDIKSDVKKTNNIVQDFQEAKETDVSIDKALQDIEKDLEVLEMQNKKRLKDRDITVDGKASITDVPEAFVEEATIDEIKQRVYGYVEPTDALRKEIDDNVEHGLLTAAEYRKVSAEVDKYKNLPDPYGSNQTVGVKSIVTQEDIVIGKEETTMVAPSYVLDPSMKESSLLVFDKNYIKNVLHKDILSMTYSLQKAGVLVKNHEVEVVHSVLGGYEHHTLELKPLDGASSTIHFKLPIVDENGVMKSSGNSYFLRKQRTDCPLRKIAPNEVALSSYYGKTFVSRGTKKANNTIEWVVKQINKAYLDTSEHITKIAPANVYDNNYSAPYLYSALAEHFKGFKVGKYNFNFDHTDELSLGGNKDMKSLKEKGYQVCGYTDTSEPIVIDKDDLFHVYTKSTFIPIGNIYKVLGLRQVDAPYDYSEVKVFSKTVAVGVVLGYHIGFYNLIKLLGATHRVIDGRRVKDMEDHEYPIIFNDKVYIFNKNEKLNTLILSGFLQFEKELKSYPESEFNKKDVYLNLLSSKGLSSIYIREMELIDQLFVDPITKSILEEMHEPITFKGLLIRSSEMLLNHEHPDSQDMNHMRIRGYERFAGAVYKELAMAIRQYKSKNMTGKGKINISPYQVWSSVMKDSALKIIEDINPIQNLKESEIITYAGEGGRGKDSMNKASRAYHVNDVGVVSEATVDSSDVGVNAYLSPNPNFSSLRGIPKINKDLKPSNILSTSALNAVGSDRDD